MGVADGGEVAVAVAGGVSVGTGVSVGVEVPVTVAVAVKVGTRVLVGVGVGAGSPTMSEPREHPMVPSRRIGRTKIFVAVLRLMMRSSSSQ